MTVNTQFAIELRKRIAEELKRLRDEMDAGLAIKDYAQYQHYVGNIQSLNRVLDEFIDDVNSKLNQR